MLFYDSLLSEMAFPMPQLPLLHSALHHQTLPIFYPTVHYLLPALSSTWEGEVGKCLQLALGELALPGENVKDSKKGNVEEDRVVG